MVVSVFASGPPKPKTRRASTRIMPEKISKIEVGIGLTIGDLL
tara:strand:- start:386 stop:514 length:129 start_codon:yes stop_codon:yes gene_type:complete